MAKIAPTIFDGATWNMFEAGHGKGAADAIGGVLKRTADRHVLMGHDITNAAVMYAELSHLTDVKLFFVEDQQIAEIKLQLPDGVKPIKGTMNLHQVCLTDQLGTISVGDVSCFCQYPEPCNCYGPRLVATDPPTPSPQTAETVAQPTDPHVSESAPTVRRKFTMFGLYRADIHFNRDNGYLHAIHGSYHIYII